MALLEVKDLHVFYGMIHAIKGISFEVRDGEIVCTRAGSDLTIPCDSVISSVGYVPAPIAAEGKNVYLVGDCDKVGNLRSVIWKAYETAMKI